MPQLDGGHVRLENEVEHRGLVSNDRHDLEKAFAQDRSDPEATMYRVDYEPAIADLSNGNHKNSMISLGVKDGGTVVLETIECMWGWVCTAIECPDDCAATVHLHESNGPEG